MKKGVNKIGNQGEICYKMIQKYKITYLWNIWPLLGPIIFETKWDRDKLNFFCKRRTQWDWKMSKTGVNRRHVPYDLQVWECPPWRKMSRILLVWKCAVSVLIGSILVVTCSILPAGSVSQHLVTTMLCLWQLIFLVLGSVRLLSQAFWNCSGLIKPFGLMDWWE